MNFVIFYFLLTNADWTKGIRFGIVVCSMDLITSINSASRYFTSYHIVDTYTNRNNVWSKLRNIRYNYFLWNYQKM